MQIYSFNSVQPANAQNFKGSHFFRVPEDVAKIFKDNDSFQSLSKFCDIEVTATAKEMKWLDPLRWRTPKRNEKAALACVVRNKDTGACVSSFNATDRGNLYGKLDVLVGDCINKIEKIDTEERLDRLMR